MITGAKFGIFKTRHPANLGVLGSSRLISAWQSNLIYLLLYIDDIIITRNNFSLLDSFARKLHSEFATNDLGSLSYFLGLASSLILDGLFLSQLKYAWDILTCAQLLDNKLVTLR
ncbi:hypothetical protein SADUNF_Sadunf05G0140400 [Salix dunnii]|uniref:Reverse transcriptase Ty1/copia-type domain-containing protein n=1 Tax=Salix dunnii TaxID=1413687 RepID=A0A835MZG9_9ROSI|nr:hypothetical protein SADUNF_Sadunf05G0140400 [Salix dunnii]